MTNEEKTAMEGLLAAQEVLQKPFNILDFVVQPSARPPIVVLYGQPGIGKTTLAATLPDPIFLLTENGIPEDENGQKLKINALPVRSRGEYDIWVERLLKDGGKNFRSLVLDSADHLDMLFLSRLRETMTDQEQSYGRLQLALRDQWREFLTFAKTMASKKVLVFLIAHSLIERIETPTAAAYDRFNLKMEKKSREIITESADLIAFYDFNRVVSSSEKSDKIKKVNEFGRKIYLSVSGQAVAKTRAALPAEMTPEAFINALIERM